MRSLSARVTVAVLAVVLVVSLGGGLVILATTTHQYRRDYDASLRRVAMNLAPPFSGALGVGRPGEPAQDTSGPHQALIDAFGHPGPDDVRFARAIAPDGQSLTVGDVPTGFPAAEGADPAAASEVNGAAQGGPAQP
ncbi:MAG: hypothetical protein QOF76_4275, partial [Solirubrobacteraceae bacterium]|nr:hypothetical protein [Solirubrobacteraceae bacterium]